MARCMRVRSRGGGGARAAGRLDRNGGGSGWMGGGRNCAQCSMRPDDQKAHIEESMCASVTCACKKVGAVLKIAAIPYIYACVSVYSEKNTLTSASKVT